MKNKKPPFLKFLHDEWVNETLNHLSLKEKLGQLFQVAAFSHQDPKHEAEISRLINDYHIGGLTFFQGDPEHQVRLTNQYQLASKVPLFINIDAEWGLAMRLNYTTQFPYQQLLGALQDDELIFQMAKKIGKHCKRIGVHSPLAPVVDINNNPKNPVINYRSFGEDKKKVAKKAKKYIYGLQEAKVLDCAKHFPGHGDTATDSHLDMPIIRHLSERLHDVELYPFKNLIDKGLSSIMTAHLQIPAWDDMPFMPATLSPLIINELLHEELGFEGLVMTDAMDMEGITKHFEDGFAEKLAIEAGNNLITNARSVRKGIEALQDAIESGELDMQKIDQKVRHILAMKKWVGLDHWEEISLYNLHEDLNDEESHALNKQLARKTITLLENEYVIPVPKNQKIALLQLQNSTQTTSVREQKVAHHLKDLNTYNQAQCFASYMKEYTDNLEVIQWESIEGVHLLSTNLKKLQDYDTIVVSFHQINKKPFNHFDLPVESFPLLESLMEMKDVILVFPGNAYALNEFPQAHKAKGVILSYQESMYTQKALVETIFGENEAEGKLPVTINERWKAGYGL